MAEPKNKDYADQPGQKQTLANSKSVSFGGVYDMQENAAENRMGTSSSGAASPSAADQQAASSTQLSAGEPLGGEAFMGGESAPQLPESELKEGDGEESEYEMVEEEGEEEVEEMEDPDKPADENEPSPTKKKVKRMVKRKKKKMKEKSPRAKDFKQQMPEWTEALEIEYMNKDQLHRVINRLRKEGMAESDIKLAEDLHYRRATFQMDQYVKLSEVRGIVNEAIHSILDRLGKADTIARKNRTEINLLDTKLKNQQQQVSHLKRIENGQNQLIRLQKEQQGKLADNQQSLTDLKYELHSKREERKLLDQDYDMRIHTLGNRALAVDKQVEQMQNKMQSANEKLHEFIETSKLTFGAKMTSIENQVKELPNKLEQQVILVTSMKSEIEKKSTQQFSTICETLKLDSNRLLEIEGTLKLLDDLKMKFSHMLMEVGKLRHLDDAVFQLNCFIERTLPVMIHHQLCEGLNYVAGTDLDELMKFEKQKTDELVAYGKLCDGIKPNVKRLRTALEAFQEHIVKHEFGSAPFIYGEGQDYWPDITMKYLNAYDKQFYFDEREAPILSKIADAERERQTRLEEHITHLFQCERDATKLLIHNAVTELKENIVNQSGRVGGVAGLRGRGPSKESNRNHMMSPQSQNYQSPFPNQQHYGASPFGQQHGAGSYGNTQSSMQPSGTAGTSMETTKRGSRGPKPKPSRTSMPRPPHQQQASAPQANTVRQRAPVAPSLTQPLQQVPSDSSVQPPPLDITQTQAQQQQQQQHHTSALNTQQSVNRFNKKASDYDDQASESRYNDQSYHTASQYLQQPPQKIIQETRYVNNMRVVKKIDKMSLHTLKQKVKEFMAEGRSEFHSQLLKWQVLFEETSEDQYEVQSRVEKLEAMVEILGTQIETSHEKAKYAEMRLQLQQEQLDGHENYLIEIEEDQDMSDLQPDSRMEESNISSEIPLDNSSKSQSESKDNLVNNAASLSAKSRSSATPQQADYLSVSDLQAVRMSKPSETPDPPKMENTPYLGYQASQTGYIDNMMRRGSMGAGAPRFRRSLTRTSIKELQVLHQKKLSSLKNVDKTGQPLEPIHESIDENDEKQAQQQSVNRPSDSSEITVSFTTRKTKLSLAVDKVEGVSQRSSQKSPRTPNRQSRLAKLTDATNNVISKKEGPKQSTPSSNQKQSSRSLTQKQKEKQDAQIKQVENLNNGLKRMRPAKQATQSSSSENTVSSFNTFEKRDNREAEGKLAGISFKFAAEMQRKTLSRMELTNLIQEKFDMVANTTKFYTDSVHDKMNIILHKEQEMRKQIESYQEETRSSMKEFIDIQVAELKQKGFEMQEKLLVRINHAEESVEDFQGRLVSNERDLKIMTERMQQEYKDFLQNRKRWKSDFQSADSKNKDHIERVHGMISGCENQNEINTRAIKMILDAQMIEQLLQRQEIEDRKQLMVMSQKTNKEMMSTDLGVHAREIFGPKIDPSKLKNDRAKTLPGKSPVMKLNSLDARVPSVFKPQPEDSNANQNVDLQSFEDNATRIDPPLLRVDRNCLNCSDNKTATLNAIRVACLGYSQSPITYQGKNYYVGDLLDTKAQVVAKCQRMLRENLFQTKENFGIDIRGEDNERGFVITPLIDTQPIKVETKLEDLMRKPVARQSDIMGSLLLFDGQQSPRDGRQASLAESSIQQIRENRYAHQLTPKAELQGSDFKARNGSQPLDMNIAGEKIRKTLTKSRVVPKEFIQSQQHNVSTEGDDLFSSNQNLNSQSISIPQQPQPNRGQSQLTQHKQPSALNSGRTQFAHIRFASTSKIKNNTTRNNWDDVRRSMQNPDMGALPDLKQQRGAFPQKLGNADFENMLEFSAGNASTKHSHVRQNSVITGVTSLNNVINSKHKMINNRNQARVGNSVMMESNYRAMDGFAQQPVKKVTTTGSRPNTQGDNKFRLPGESKVTRVNSYHSSQGQAAPHH